DVDDLHDSSEVHRNVHAHDVHAASVDGPTVGRPPSGPGPWNEAHVYPRVWRGHTWMSSVGRVGTADRRRGLMTFDEIRWWSGGRRGKPLPLAPPPCAGEGLGVGATWWRPSTWCRKVP